jgi:GNAT superfamily N-acetyltransferase
VKRLQNIQSTSTNAGLLAQHSGTYAHDAINDFMGQRNKIIGEDLGLEWYMYVGSNLTTTREFCEHLTKKKYVHKSEIPTILSGDIDGHECEIYAKTGLPLGLKDGTTPENFIVHRGGWNCGHQLVPVAPEAVPEDVRKKIEEVLQPPVQPFIMDGKAENELKDLGYNLPSGFIKDYNNSQIAGFNLPKFNRELKKILDDNSVRITQRDIGFLSDSTEIVFYGSYVNGGTVKLVRTFRIENGEKAVHHDYFTLPNELQGKGISKKVFKVLYEQYRNAGVTKMDVLANIDVGGYTWAKYGFTANRKEIKRIIRQRRDIAGHQEAQEIVDDFISKNPDTKMFPMNLLTGKTWSKDLLKGSGWEGFLDLNNKYQREVFEGYIDW